VQRARGSAGERAALLNNGRPVMFRLVGGSALHANLVQRRKGYREWSTLKVLM
jgi:hypothetical protein